MSGCLLLNASWEPLTVVDVKRAVVLVIKDKAEVIVESGLPFRSAKLAIATPSVIRLKYFVKVPYKEYSRPTRRSVLSRDDHICQFTHCNRKAETIDHVVPTSKGGRHEWSNLVAACSICNSKKADKSMQQLNWKLKRTPTQPKGGSSFLLDIRKKEEWLPYIPRLVN